MILVEAFAFQSEAFAFQSEAFQFEAFQSEALADGLVEVIILAAFCKLRSMIIACLKHLDKV